MFRKLILPALAALGVVFAVYSVVIGQRQIPPAQPVTQPAQPQFDSYVAGAGIVEASTENIAVGTLVPGVVTEIFVKIGDPVKAGAPLFRIDDRDLRSELKVRETSLRAALAQLHRLEQMPRPEDVPPAEAAVEEARARLLDSEAAYNRDQNLFQKKMLAASDFDKDRYTMQAARATLAKAEADLAKLKAGAWKEDIDVQRAAVEQAQSQVENIKIMLDRLVVRAPVDGEILQVNVRPGQFAAMAHAVFNTQPPSVSISPSSSAIGMNTDGGMKLPSSSRSRSSASNPLTSRVRHAHSG